MRQRRPAPDGEQAEDSRVSPSSAAQPEPFCPVPPVIGANKGVGKCQPVRRGPGDVRLRLRAVTAVRLPRQPARTSPAALSLLLLPVRAHS
jgi:hypothetical protein